ncbi:hypothetical protein BH10ACI4_BH10ACI4_13190 [soil metagenome]
MDLLFLKQAIIQPKNQTINKPSYLLSRFAMSNRLKRFNQRGTNSIITGYFGRRVIFGCNTMG